jgi:hypothetical protein
MGTLASSRVGQSSVQWRFALLARAFGRTLQRSEPFAILLLVLGSPGSVLPQTKPRQWETVASLQLDSRPPMLEVTDAAIAPNGDVVLLDGVNARVVRLARTGSTFRVGPRVALRGMPSPESISFDAAGKLHVFDSYRGLVGTFAFVGDTLRLESSTAVSPGAAGMCVNVTNRVLLAPSERHLLAVLGFDGRPLVLFGVPFGRDSLPEIVAASASFGPMLCSQRSQSILVSSGLLGEVRRYTLSGSLLWRIQLARFRGLLVSTDGETSATFRPRPGGSDELLSIIMGPEDQVLVQLGVLQGTGGSRFRSQLVETRLIDVATGVERGIVRDLPPLIGLRGIEYYGAEVKDGVLTISVMIPKSYRRG